MSHRQYVPREYVVHPDTGAQVAVPLNLQWEERGRTPSGARRFVAVAPDGSLWVSYIETLRRGWAYRHTAPRPVAVETEDPDEYFRKR
jgi:hypothetical protein